MCPFLNIIVGIHLYFVIHVAGIMLSGHVSWAGFFLTHYFMKGFTYLFFNFHLLILEAENSKKEENGKRDKDRDLSLIITLNICLSWQESNPGLLHPCQGINYFLYLNVATHVCMFISGKLELTFRHRMQAF